MKTGYQGSETSRAEVIVYTHGENFLRDQYDGRKISFRGAKASEPGLSAVRTSKLMGAAAGSFMFEVKAHADSDADLRGIIRDDDWVDIVLYRHNRPFHVMRGLVDAVMRHESKSASGANVVRYVVTGRDFGKIFEQQTLWFDRVTKGNYAAAAATRIWSEQQNFANGRVDDTVRNMLLGFLVPTSNQGAGLWVIPNSLTIAGGIGGSDFYQTISINTRDFSNVPARSSAINPTMFSLESPNLWALAQEWADPMLCEFFVDLTHQPLANYLGDDAECTPKDTMMSVILRDRPFPNGERDVSGLIHAPYFTKIPLHVVGPEAVRELSVARSGAERKNAFFFAPKLLQEIAVGYQDMQLPLVNAQDIRLHGMRRLDAISRYISNTTEGDYVTMARGYRNIVRDIHCMNHLFLNGTIALGYGRPDVRIGSRFRIAGRSSDADETYYVEGVHHTWAYDPGVKTSLDVTRGWIGTDQSLVDTLTAVRNEYVPDDVPPIQLGDTSDGESTEPTDEATETLVSE